MSVSIKFIKMQIVLLLVLLSTVFLAPNLTFWVFIGAEAAFLALLVVDFKTSASKKDIILSREKEIILFFKSENIVTMTISNHFLFPIEVEIKDRLPYNIFLIRDSNLSLMVEPGETKEASYSLNPQKRGAFPIESVDLKVKNRLGLGYQTINFLTPTEMKVYPNVRNLSKYRMIVQKDRLLHHEGRVIKEPLGLSEFESLKEYVVGDEFKHINWKATARGNKLMVNQYEPEKNQPIVIMMDTSRAMSYSIKGNQKLDYSIESALILADIVNQKGDLAGLITFDAQVSSQIKPNKGPAHRAHLIETLYHVKSSLNTPNYEAAFQAVNKMQQRRSVIFIFTDFETMEEAKDLQKQLPLIKAHLPIIMLMKNFHGEQLLSLDEFTLENQFTKASAINYFNKRRAMIQKLNTRQVGCMESDADSFAMAAVNRYLSVKARGV